MENGNVVVMPRDVVRQQRKQQFDWAVLSVELTMHECERLGMADITETLESVHAALLERRDRA